MRLRAPVFIFLAGLLLSATIGPAQQTPPANRGQASVLDFEKARLHALTGGDLPALGEMMTADCTYVHSNGRVQSKREFLDALAGGAMRYQVFRWIGPPAVRLYGASFAVLTGKAHLEVTLRTAGELKFDVLYTAAYTVTDTGWKLASYQSTEAPK